MEAKTFVAVTEAPQQAEVIAAARLARARDLDAELRAKRELSVGLRTRG